MKVFQTCSTALILLLAATLGGCSTAAKSADVSVSIRKALDDAGFKEVKVAQDLEKGVVTLSGSADSEANKLLADRLARDLAPGQVVANQIGVLPPGAEKDAKAINDNVDSGIEKNLNAALIANKMKDGVKFAVKSSVVTLSGEVASQALRTEVGQVAMGVPYVKQVVNELQVKNQKASSAN